MLDSFQKFIKTRKEKNIFFLPRSRPEDLVSRETLGCTAPRQPALSTHPKGIYRLWHLPTGSSPFPRSISGRHAMAYRWRSLQIESAATRPAGLRVAVTGAGYPGKPIGQSMCASISPHFLFILLILLKVLILLILLVLLILIKPIYIYIYYIYTILLYILYVYILYIYICIIYIYGVTVGMYGHTCSKSTDQPGKGHQSCSWSARQRE